MWKFYEDIREEGELVGYNVQADDREIVGQEGIFIGHYGMTPEQMLADTRMICASPEMFRVLKSIIEYGLTTENIIAAQAVVQAALTMGPTDDEN